jgi:hypothetical protein
MQKIVSRWFAGPCLGAPIALCAVLAFLPPRLLAQPGSGSSDPPGAALTISLSHKHPDTDKPVTVTANASAVNPVSLQITVDGRPVASGTTSTLTYTGGPYATHPNQRLEVCAIAQLQGGGTARECDSLYVAHPPGVMTRPLATGSYRGYPASHKEQTAANLYRLDREVVHEHAANALAEYVNWYNARTPSLADDITLEQAASIADHMVAAVAYYVDAHMTWRSDDENRAVFAAHGYGDYDPGWDFPQPADLTLTVSGGNQSNPDLRDDFFGDCEDHAILRAALLRALGFAPWAIWNVIDNPVTHEYNVVLYDGAFRVMDYGMIDRWLEEHKWDSHRTHYGWNEEHGPRDAGPANHNYLRRYADNYPGGVEDGKPWSFEIYYRKVSP